VEADLDQVTADIPRWRNRRPAAGLAFAVYLSLLGAFFLPFASVSCQTGTLSVRSEVMTGWELVTQDDYVLIEGPGDPEQGSADVDPKEKVENALLSLSRAATIEFTFVVLCLLLALGALLSNGHRLVVWLLIFSGFLAVLGCLTLLTAGSGGDFFVNADVHHHYGFFIATILAVAGLIVDFGLFRVSTATVGDSGINVWIGLVLLFFAIPFAIFALVLGLVI